MTEPRIAQLAASAQIGELTDERLVELYAPERSPWLRVNFVSSLDGAATLQGLSGGLADAADRRVFDLLRRLCDVVVVGAGTVRAEGYGAMRVDEASQRARLATGLTAHPVFTIVSASLDLDPDSPIFTNAPERPILVTTEGALPRSGAFEAVADVIVGGRERVEPERLVAGLAERGLDRIHCEGGPHLFGDLIAAGVLDELCLTLAPTLAAGSAPRISAGAASVPRDMRLAHALRSGDTLLLRYVRP